MNNRQALLLALNAGVENKVISYEAAMSVLEAWNEAEASEGARWKRDHPGGVITPEERASLDAYRPE